MMLSRVHKFLYLGIPKTGTHSVSRFLGQHYQARAVASYHGSSYEIPPDYLAWGTVRNPYARLLSWWHAWVSNKKGKDQNPPRDISFVDFIDFLLENREGLDMPEDRRDMRWPQHLFMTRQPWQRFVRIEHFAHDFAALPFGKPGAKLDRRNQGRWTEEGGVASFYREPELAAARRYGVIEECRQFGYSEDVADA